MEKTEEKTWLDEHKLWKLVIGSIILAIGLAVAWQIAVKQPTLVGLSILGIVIFFISLIGGNILSKDDALTTGEVRRAIAIASTAVFFGLFFLESIPPDHKPLIDNFWKVYAVIIGFYFATRAAEEIKKNGKKRTD